MDARPQVEPFTIEEAETIIAASHCAWEEVLGNYEEFRFFTGLRPAEQFGLKVDDCDGVRGAVCIRKVGARKKSWTDTNE